MATTSNDRAFRRGAMLRLRRVAMMALSVLMLATSLTIAQSVASENLPSAEARGGGVGAAPFPLPRGPNTDRFGGVNCPMSTETVTRVVPGWTPPEGVTPPPAPPTYTVTLRVYRCEWWEREWRRNSGYWQTRPELINDGFGGRFATRAWPSFTDPLVDIMYLAAKAGERGNQDITISPSTVSTSLPVGPSRLHPCMFKGMNGSPAILVGNGLEFDQIDWAKSVRYELELYSWWTAVWVDDPDPYNPRQYFRSSPRLNRYLGRPNFEPNKPFSKVTFQSCSGAGLGSEAAVTVYCPVYADKIVIEGPYGNGLPSRSDRNTNAEQTKSKTITLTGKRDTPFAKNHWNSGSMRQAKKDSQGAPGKISIVKNCRNNTQVAVGRKMLSPGNYDFTVTMKYVACSYSILPGYSNNTFFGGCQTAPTRTEVHPTYTSNARCDGNLVRGRNNTYDFDPAECYAEQCNWRAPETTDRIVVSNPNPATLGDSTPPLRGDITNPRGDRVFANGVPTLWSLRLRDIRIAQSPGLPAPTRVTGADKTYTTFELGANSTPWNPLLPRTQANVNKRPGTTPSPDDQYFFSVSEDGSRRGVLSLLGSGLKSKDANRRIEGWQGMYLSAYSSSVSAFGQNANHRTKPPMMIRIHQHESWRLPTRVPFIATVGERFAEGGSARQEVIEQVMECSSRPFFSSATATQCQGCVSYVSNRLIPVTR